MPGVLSFYKRADIGQRHILSENGTKIQKNIKKGREKHIIFLTLQHPLEVDLI